MAAYLQVVHPVLTRGAQIFWRATTTRLLGEALGRRGCAGLMLSVNGCCGNNCGLPVETIVSNDGLLHRCRK